MQLYERGLLDLDADVNKYLQIQLQNPYPEPVKVAQLMTHTDGTKRRIGLAASLQPRWSRWGLLG